MRELPVLTAFTLTIKVLTFSPEKFCGENKLIPYYYLWSLVCELIENEVEKYSREGIELNIPPNAKTRRCSKTGRRIGGGQKCDYSANFRRTLTYPFPHKTFASSFVSTIVPYNINTRCAWAGGTFFSILLVTEAPMLVPKLE